jgi:hypothetical protein
MVLSIDFAVAAENVRHLRPGAGHRTGAQKCFGGGRLWRYGARMRQQVQRAGRRTDLARSDAQVFGGCGQAATAEQQLNGPQISAGFEQMDSECVPQRMRCDLLGKAGQAMCFLAGCFDGIPS